MPDPMTPVEVPDRIDLGDLAALCYRHQRALLLHRLDIEPLSAEEFQRHALADLVFSTALSERAQRHRWLSAVEALAAGATRERVAGALGLDMDELRAGIRSWVRGQSRFDLIDAERVAEVLALLDEPEGTT